MNFSMYRWLLGAGLIAGAALLTGCEEELTQDDVNQHRREAQTALEEAREEAREAQADADRQIAMVERERRETIADLRARQNDPDADTAEIRDEIEAANREADRKIAEIRREAAGDLKGVHEAAQKELSEARLAEDRYESQQTRDRYIQDTEQMLAKMDANIARLEDRVDLGRSREPAGFDRMMDIVEQRREQVRESLDALKAADIDEWKTYQDEVENSLDQLKSAYADAVEGLGSDRR